MLTVFEDGAQVAAHQLPAKNEGHIHRYLMRTSRSEPVVGGHAYCFVVDMDLDMVHVFENAEYVASEELPETGEPVL